MGKRARQSGRSNRTASPARRQTKGSAQTPQTTPTVSDDDAAALEMAAEEALRGLGVDAGAISQPDDSSLDPAVAAARHAEALFEVAKARTDEVRKRVEDQLTELSAQREQLDARSAEQAEERDLLAERERELSDRKGALEEREEHVLRREAEAEAGFLARREAILAPVTTQLRQLSASWHEQQMRLLAEWNAQLEEERAAWTAERRKRLDELAIREEQITGREAQLVEQRRALERESTTVASARRDLELQRVAVDDAEEEIRAEAVRAADVQLAALRRANADLTGQLSELQELQLAVATLQRELGDDPASAARRLTELKADAAALRAELLSRPSADVLAELAILREDKRRLHDELLEVDRQRDELQRQLDFAADVHQRAEDAELRAAAAFDSLAAHRTTIEQLQRDLQSLVAQREEAEAFPGCAEDDRKYGKAAPRETAEVADLEAFVEDLRLRMAHDPNAARRGEVLAYRRSDLRLFLAGLAASRLHILEGVSGTGKTTMPGAFASAIGAAHRKIEVQAGWRDKQDLVGYYNTFEHVYRETAFLRYLYRAAQPCFGDTPVFIILDEMNLSHPEQYFADFLSALEDRSSEPRISILDRAVPAIPAQMIAEAGVQIRLPDNVWFIGTANQDETTFGFAPKVYDRAHVMDLKPGAEPVEAGQPPPGRNPVGLSSLRRAFADAQQGRPQEQEKAVRFIASIEPIVNTEFQVGWGHRLGKYARIVVAVNSAAGGSLGEALDHVVATKVLKKIRGRYTVRREGLERLRDSIDAEWPDASRRPAETFTLLDAELMDLGSR